MKKFLTLSLTISLALFFFITANAQLSGNYTIDPSGSGSNNFTSISAAITSLNSNGVSGPVKFTISYGNYSGNISLGKISGSSAVNTITFDGQDSSGTRIYNSSSGTGILTLAGGKHFIFRNLTIENTYQYGGYGVYMYSGADSNIFENCVLKADNYSTSSNRTVYLSDGRDNIFRNNMVLGGYYGFYFYGTSSYNITGTIIQNNIFRNQYYYNARLGYTENATITGNHFDSTENSFSYCLDQYYCRGTVFTHNLLTKTGNAGYGIRNYYENRYSGTPSTMRSRYENNMVGGDWGTSNSTYPMYFYYAYRLDIYNNSVNVNSSGGGYGLYMNVTTGARVFNNSIQINAPSGTYVAYIRSTSYVDSLDYNNFYNTSSSGNFVYFNFSHRSDLSSLKSASSSYNQNSVSGNAEYYSDADLHSNSLLLNNAGHKGVVSTDYDGETRPISPDKIPDIGADEFYLPPKDLDIISIIEPSVLKTGSNNVSAELRNMGTDTITNETVYLRYSADNTNWVLDTLLISTLAPAATLNFDFTKKLNITVADTYDICLDISTSVNNDPDTDEKLCLTFCTGMQDTIVVDGMGSGDYSTISAAIEALGCGGFVGPVVILIKPGTYNEQVVIPSIPGASSTNTLTLLGDSATISYAGNATSMATVLVRSARFVLLKNLNIENTGTSEAAGVLITGDADSIAIHDCNISLPLTASHYNSAGITLTSSETSVSSSGNSGNNISIMNNTITGGYYGIRLNGSSSSFLNGLVVENNDVIQPYYYGIYLYYMEGAIVNENRIDSNRTANGYGIYGYYSIKSRVTKNKIFPGSYGIYFYRENYYASSSDTSVIINNMIGNFSSTSDGRGISVYYSDRIHVLHNSVETNFSTTSTSYGTLYIYNSDNNIIKNNTFSNLGSGYTVIQLYGTVQAGQIDYNNYYGPNSSTDFYISFSNYSDLAAWQSGNSNLNGGSISTNPMFVSGKDLHSGSPEINNSGTDLGITTDIDGEARPMSPDTIPDIGADEFYLPPHDLDVTNIISPLVPAIGNNTISAEFISAGTDSLFNDTIIVQYSVNGGTPVTDTMIFDTLGVGETISFSFKTPYYISALGTHNYCVRIIRSVANDPDTLDEICIEKCVGISGTYTIDGSGNGDYKSFAEAVAALSCGVTGSVTFNVKPGTYQEQVILNSIPGINSDYPVTFQGTGTDSVRITYTGSSTSSATVLLNGASYITFRDLTIRNTSTSYAIGVLFTNGASYNTIESCNINVSSTYYYSAGITATNHLAYPGYSGNNDESNNIFNNTIRGGYYGIYLLGPASNNSSRGGRIIGNRIFGPYNSGIQLQYKNNNIVRSNYIDSISSSSGYGIYSYYNYANTFNANKIHTGQNGIYLYRENYYGSSTDTTWVTNNMISALSDGTYQRNIYGYYAYRINFYHNSLWGDHSSASSSYATAYLYYCYYSNFKNNTVTNTGGGYAIRVYYGSWGSGSIDYNNYYAPNSTYPIIYNFSSYSSLAAWQSSYSNYNANSISSDAGHLSINDLHTISINLNNAGKKGLYSTDYDGESRPISPDPRPDIGADEYYLPPFDLDVNGVEKPSIALIGNNTVAGRFFSNGISAIQNDTAIVAYSINGGSWVLDTLFIDSLGSGDDTLFTFKTPWTISADTSYELCLKILDGIAGEPDTLDLYCQTICTGARDTFVIDQSGNGDFLSFNDAVDYLKCAGVAGKIVFNIIGGNYSETLEIPEIRGVSATNTVTFSGEGKNLVFLNASSGSNYAVLTLDGADHFTFENMSISNTSNINAFGVLLTNGADSNTIRNCNITLPQNTTSSSTAAITFSGSKTSSSTSGNSGNGNTITGNLIFSGYYGIRINGSSTSSMIMGNTISNNTFRNFYYYALLQYYSSGSIISNNDIDSSGSSYSYSIASNYSSNTKVTGNKILPGQYGLYFYYENYYNSTDTSLVANNMISDFDYYYRQRAGYFYRSDRMYVLNNSIWTTQTSTSTSDASVYFYYSDNSYFKNNSVSSTGGGLAMYYYGGTYNNRSFDYNNYYAPNSSSMAYWKGSFYSSLSSWQSGDTAANKFSVSGDPGYYSSLDLHARGDILNNAGQKSFSMAVDFDGESRPILPDTIPDIGADEFLKSDWDLDLVSIDNPSIVYIGNNTISATLINKGDSTINDTLMIEYSVNGGAWVPDQLMINGLSNLNTMLHNFTTPWMVTEDTLYEVCVRVMPGLSGDPDTLDQVCRTFCVAKQDTLIVDASGNGDFTTIRDAVNRLYCGLSGPVVIIVKNGTYKEQVVINKIPGVDKTNTITIIGEDSANTIISSAGSPGNIATVLINETDFVTLRNLTIKNTGTGDGAGIIVMNGADSFSLYNSIVEMGNSSSSNNAVFSLSSSKTDVSTTDGMNDYVTLENNIFSGGYYGVFLAGGFGSDNSMGNRVVNNIISDARYIGFVSYYLRDLEFINNSVDNQSNSGTYGIYSYYSSGENFTRNQVFSDYNGVYIYRENFSFPSDSTLFINNIVALNNGNSSERGLTLYYSDNFQAYHNSIQTSHTNNSSSYGALFCYDGNDLILQNNIFSNTGGGLALSIYSNTSFADGNVDYNNYYAPSSVNPFYFLGNYYSSFAALQSGNTVNNINSIYSDPLFNSTDDYHAGNSTLLGSGKPVGVFQDFEGDDRDTLTPDIGADEFRRDIGVMAIHSPVPGCELGQETIVIELKNYGQNAFSAGDRIPVIFSTGGTTANDTVDLSQNLYPNDTYVDTLSIKSDLSAYGSHNLTAETDYPDDTDPSNDNSVITVRNSETPQPDYSVKNVCQGDTSMFVNNSTLSTNDSIYYYWFFDTEYSTDEIDPEYAFPWSGKHNVRLTAYTSYGCRDSFTDSGIYVHPNPVSSFSATSVCYGDTLYPVSNSTVATGNIISYNWDFDNGTSSTQESPSIVYPNSGDYDITLIVESDSGCIDTSIKAVNIASQPVANFQAAPVCFGDSTEFVNTSSISCGVVSSYFWDFGDDNTSSLFSPNHQYAKADTYQVSLIITLEYGLKDTSTHLVIVHDKPDASFSSSRYCHEEMTAFVNNSSIGNGTISSMWDFGDSETSSMESPFHKYADTGDYRTKLIVTSALGCTDTATQDFHIFEKPKASFTAGDNCLGENTSFTNNSTFSSGNLSITWDFDDGNSSTVNNPVHRFGYDDTFRVKLYTTSPDGCPDTAEMNIAIHPLPELAFTTSNTCFGDSVSFTNNSSINSGSINSYQWDFGDGNSSIATSPDYPYGAAGTYGIKLFGWSDQGCADSSSLVQITIHPKPEASFTASDVCNNEKVSFKNTSSITGGSIISHNWDFGDGNSSNSMSPSHLFSLPDTYSVTLVTLTGYGCRDTARKNIIAHAVPAADFSASTVCDGNSVNFTNKTTISSGSVTSYSWNFGDGKTGTSANPSHLYSGPGTYNVQLIAKGSSGCNDTITRTVTVNPKPSAAFSTQNECFGTEVDFVNNSTVKGSFITSFEWKFGDNKTSKVSDPSHLYGSAGTYNASLIVSTPEGCYDTAGTSVTIHPRPVAGFSAFNSCVNDPMSFKNSTSIASGSISSYSWDFGDGQSTNATSPSHSYSSDGLKNISLIAISNNGCRDTVIRTYRVNEKPVAGFSSANVCQGEPMNFFNTSSFRNGKLKYTWDFDDNQSSSAKNVSHTYAAAGKYNVYLIVTTDSNCMDTSLRTMVVNPTPSTVLSSKDACMDETIQFSESSTIASGSVTGYLWHFGDGNMSQSQNPAHKYSSPGTFDINLVTTSDSGCMDTGTMLLTVFPEPEAQFNTANSCFGDTLLLTGASMVSGGTITGHEWDLGDGTVAQGNSVSHFYTKSRTYDIQLITTTDKGCVDTLVQSILIAPKPVAGFSVSDNCPDIVTSFMDTSTVSSGTIISYFWEFGDGLTDVNANPRHIYSVSDTYDVRMIVYTDNACSDTADGTVTIFPAPEAAFDWDNTCLGDTAFFANRSTIPAGTLSSEWHFGDGMVSSATDAGHLYANYGNYRVKLISISGFGCRDSMEADLTIHPKPTASFTSEDVCFGEDKMFTGTSTVDNGRIIASQWNFGDGAHATTMNPSHFYANAGSYLVELVSISNLGCSDTVSIMSTVFETPDAGFETGLLCHKDTIVFKDISSQLNDSVSYHWDFGDGETSIVRDPAKLYAAPGNYNVKLLQWTANGCKDSALQDITVHPSPVSSFEHSLIWGGRIQFTPDSMNYPRYSWRLGDSSSSTEKDFIHQYKFNGVYAVVLRVTDTTGCYTVTKDTVVITNSRLPEIAGPGISFEVYPNPFLTESNISYSISRDADVQLDVVDVHGKVIRVFQNGKQTKGVYSYLITDLGDEVRAGVLFVRLRIDDKVLIRRLILAN